MKNYVEIYNQLKDKVITIEELNKFTEVLEKEYMESISLDEFELNLITYFNRLHGENIEIIDYDDDEENEPLLFDVINYPGDHVVALYYIYLGEDKIKITHVGEES